MYHQLHDKRTPEVNLEVLSDRYIENNRSKTSILRTDSLQLTETTQECERLTFSYLYRVRILARGA